MKRKERMASARVVYGCVTVLGYMCLFGAESFDPRNSSFYFALVAALITESALTRFAFGTLKTKTAAQPS